MSQWLLPHMKRRRFKAGEVLFRKGEVADKLIYIASGQLRLAEIDRTVGPGELLGEIGLFSPDKLRTQTLVCETDGELYEMTDEMLFPVVLSASEDRVLYRAAHRGTAAEGRSKTTGRHAAGVVLRQQERREAAMHRIAALGLCLWLAGCGMTSTVIKTDSLTFNDVIEDATNKLLVLNVLRARDKAPLHFADIPVIRESMQQSASLSILDVSGPADRHHAARQQDQRTRHPVHAELRNHERAVEGVHDRDHDADRCQDREILARSRARPAHRAAALLLGGGNHRDAVRERPRQYDQNHEFAARRRDVITRRKDIFAGAEEHKCDTQSDFERYLKLINTLQTFFAHSYKERRLLASGLNLELEKDSRSLQSFASLDQSKIQLVYDKGARAYNLYALSPEPKVAFCLSDGGASAGRGVAGYEVIGAGPSALSNKQNCFRSVVEVPAEDSTHAAIVESPLAFGGPAAVREPSRYCGIYNRFVGTQPNMATGEYPKLELRLHIRSVGEIFQFLGDLVFYQEELRRYLERNPQPGIKLNTPVTFGYCGDNPTPGCDDVFLRLDGDPCNARFSLTYRDKDYHVANFDRGGDACGPRTRPPRITRSRFLRCCTNSSVCTDPRRTSGKRPQYKCCRRLSFQTCTAHGSGIQATCYDGLASRRPLSDVPAAVYSAGQR